MSRSICKQLALRQIGRTNNVVMLSLQLYMEERYRMEWMYDDSPLLEQLYQCALTLAKRHTFIRALLVRVLTCNPDASFVNLVWQMYQEGDEYKVLLDTLTDIADDIKIGFDIYRKVPKDLTQPTLTGACISICSVLFMAYLFASELLGFLQHEVVSELTVDDPVKYSEKIPVFINITLMNTACQYVGLDIQDDMGRHEVGFQDNTEKIPQNDDNGCRMESHFLINKVPGNFHVSTHSATQQPARGDMSHIIHKVRFGMELEDGKDVKGSFNPLENLDKSKGEAGATHDYIVRVVPTVYIDMNNNRRLPYQYTYSKREIMSYGHGGQMMPAIWFRYELSPITVMYTEKRKPFYHFLTTERVVRGMPAIWFKYQLSAITVKYKEMRKPFYHFLTTVCAIVGGTFTVAGILDSCIFTASEIIRKAELGKLS